MHTKKEMASDLSSHLAGTSRCVAYNLRKAARITTKIYEQEMRAAPIQGPQFSLLVIIAQRGPATISALAEAVGADRTTLTRNLRQLENKRVIEILPGADPRSKKVRVLPKGEAALRAAVKYWEKAQRKVLDTLGEDRWRRMLSDLSAVVALGERSARP
ncbi:MAG TPA: MarR family winged helix-turn-helix transcriptional regulator [Bryobacteraceae bacterium]|nr:MarR family winged helix-turn-helix transcriptional regulator [Bryobacteraceae bacterium]